MSSRRRNSEAPTIGSLGAGLHADPGIMSFSGLGVTRVSSRTSSRGGDESAASRSDSMDHHNNSNPASYHQAPYHRVGASSNADAGRRGSFASYYPPIIVTPADAESYPGGGDCVVPSMSNTTAAGGRTPIKNQQHHVVPLSADDGDIAAADDSTTRPRSTSVMGRSSSNSKGRGSFFSNSALKESRKVDVSQDASPGSSSGTPKASTSLHQTAPKPQIQPNPQFQSMFQPGMSKHAAPSDRMLGTVDLPFVCFVMLEEDVFKLDTSSTAATSNTAQQHQSESSTNVKFTLPVPPFVRVNVLDVLQAVAEDGKPASSFANSSFGTAMNNASFYSAGSWHPPRSSSFSGKQPPDEVRSLQSILSSAPFNNCVRPFFIDSSQVAQIDGVSQLKPTSVDHLVKRCLQEFPAWKYRLAKAHEHVEETRRFRSVEGGKLGAVAKASRENKSIHGPLFPSDSESRNNSSLPPPNKQKFELALLDDYHRFYNVLLAHYKRFPSSHKVPHFQDESEVKKVMEEVPAPLGKDRILQDIMDAWNSVHKVWREETNSTSKKKKNDPTSINNPSSSTALPLASSTTGSTILHNCSEVKLSYPHERLIELAETSIQGDGTPANAKDVDGSSTADNLQNIPIFVLRTAGSTPFLKLAADLETHLASALSPGRTSKYLPFDITTLNNQQMKHAASNASASAFRQVPPGFSSNDTSKRRIVPNTHHLQQKKTNAPCDFGSLSTRRIEDELYVREHENLSRRAQHGQNSTRDVKVPTKLIVDDSPLQLSSECGDSRVEVLHAVLRELFGDDVQAYSVFRSTGQMTKFRHRFWNLEQMMIVKEAFEEYCKDRHAHRAARKDQDELRRAAKDRIETEERKRKEALARSQWGFLNSPLSSLHSNLHQQSSPSSRPFLLPNACPLEPNSQKLERASKVLNFDNNGSTTTILEGSLLVNESPILMPSSASPTDACPMDDPLEGSSKVKIEKVEYSDEGSPCSLQERQKPMSDIEILAAPKIEVPPALTLPLSHKNQRMLLQKACPYFRERWDVAGLPQLPSCTKDPTTTYSPSISSPVSNKKSSLVPMSVSQAADRVRQHPGLCDFCGGVRSKHARLLEEPTNFSSRLLLNDVSTKSIVSQDKSDYASTRKLFGANAKQQPPPSLSPQRAVSPALPRTALNVSNQPKETTNISTAYSNWKDALRAEEAEENLLVSNLLNREGRRTQQGGGSAPHKLTTLATSSITSPFTTPKVLSSSPSTTPRRQNSPPKTASLSPSPLFSRLSRPKQLVTRGLSPQREVASVSDSTRMSDPHYYQPSHLDDVSRIVQDSKFGTSSFASPIQKSLPTKSKSTTTNMVSKIVPAASQYYRPLGKVASNYNNPCPRFIPLWGNNEACQNCYVSRMQHPDIVNSLTVAQQQKEERRSAIRKKKRAAYVFHEVLPWVDYIIPFCTTEVLCQLSLVNYFLGKAVKPLIVSTMHEIVNLEGGASNWKALIVSEAESIAASLLTPIGHLYVSTPLPTENNDGDDDNNSTLQITRVLPARRTTTAIRDNRLLAETLLDLLALWSVSKGPMQFLPDEIQGPCAAALSAKAKEHIRSGNDSLFPGKNNNSYNMQRSSSDVKNSNETNTTANNSDGGSTNNNYTTNSKRLASSMSDTLCAVVKHASFKDLSADLIEAILRVRSVVKIAESSFDSDNHTSLRLENISQSGVSLDDSWKEKYWNKSLYLLLLFFEALVKEKSTRERAHKYLSLQTKATIEEAAKRNLPLYM